jgi:hypothetical protein
MDIGERNGTQKMKLRAVIGLALLFLCGCADSGSDNRYANVTRPELLAELQLGRRVLRCREACLPAWRDAQPRAARLDAGSQWDDLAAIVMPTGYQDDLSLYYLGRAAEGLGFYPAAVSYYRQSMELSGTSISCANLSRLCGGVTLPADAARRLSIAQQRAKPIPRRAPTVIRARSAPATTSPAPEPTTLTPGEAPSAPTTDDNNNTVTMTPAASPPHPAVSTSTPVVNPTSESYVEPSASAGYLEPVGKAR